MCNANQRMGLLFADLKLDLNEYFERNRSAIFSPSFRIVRVGNNAYKTLALSIETGLYSDQRQFLYDKVIPHYKEKDPLSKIVSNYFSYKFDKWPAIPARKCVTI